jgi:hypothetical protein
MVFQIPRNVSEALASMGVPNLENVVNLATAPNRVGAIEFDVPSLAPGAESGNLEPRYKMSQNQNFIVTHHTSLFWTTTQPANYSRAGSRLPTFADPSPPATVGNILPGTHEIGVNFFDAEQPYYKDYMRIPQIFGSAERPYYPVKGFLILGKANFFARVKSFVNGGGANIAGEMILHGFFLPS